MTIEGSRRTDRRGITLVELLVTIGIIGILAGLLLPAVQASREAARRARCAKNLGQLIGATHQFEATLGGFPPASFYGRPVVRRDTTIGAYSLQCRLLPYIEQAALFNSINFSLPLGDLIGLERFHRTAGAYRIGLFLCPSDPNTGLQPQATNSYRACTGLGELIMQGNRLSRPSAEGFFSFIDLDGTDRRVLRTSEIPDGLSNTLAFSEKPVSTGVAYHPFRDWSSREFDGSALTADAWFEICSHLTSADPRLNAGGSWMIPGAIYTHFYASAPPNTRVPDCGTEGLNNGVGIYAARSYHPGGVNAAMADGSVRWFASGTDLRVWRGLGTRAGGEIISDSLGSGG